MSFLELFRRRGSAPVARERLQILLSYERASRGQSDLLAILREEILSAITKHVTVERDSVQVRMDRGPNASRHRVVSARPRCCPPHLWTCPAARRDNGARVGARECHHASLQSLIPF